MVIRNFVFLKFWQDYLLLQHHQEIRHEPHFRRQQYTREMSILPKFNFVSDVAVYYIHPS